MNEKAIDPVCGMKVEPHQNEIEHAGIHYAFCSVQCRERFEATPHLYVGLPGHPAPKQQGKVVAKRRRFRTETALTPDESALLRSELASMMGVTEVSVDGDTVSITYDLLQATAEQLEARMAEIGLKIGGSWKEKLRSAFVHYLEECEVDNLEVGHRRGHRHG
jgi:YHS domain-containing protein